MSSRNDLFPRASGVLLHITSLPGPDGVGDLGEPARRFVAWLAEHGQTWWQFLPLGPTSYGDSPYQTLSALAGNPLLISLEDVVRAGWLTPADLADRPDFPADRVDYGPVIEWKFGKLQRAWEGFRREVHPSGREEFERWCAAQSEWLEDYALFMAIKNEQGGAPWLEWPEDLRMRRPEALSAARGRLAAAIDAVRFAQWLFFTQWVQLRSFAAARGVRFLGDLPIFVALDSADVWAHRELFRLEENGRPTHVAGVPPDYFSETGQLWGNPLYDWNRLAQDGYQWWVRRMQASLELADVVRIDHFRGFEAYWEVPEDAETAVHGRWVPGPGRPFFEVLRGKLGGRLPVVAEDLGVITPGVEALRDDLDLPGMKVLQFAWSGPDNAFLPHEYSSNCVVYSGTHDNDPSLGWWKHLASDAEKALLERYSGGSTAEPHWTLLRLGLLSVGHTFIATMQDVLGLGREARMNLPGEGSGNWNWRMPESAYIDSAGERLAQLTWLARRRPDQQVAGAAVPDHSPNAGSTPDPDSETEPRA